MIACTACIPNWAKRIIKFDPTNPDTTSTVGEEAGKGFCCGNGVLGGDGFIHFVSDFGQVLQIDTTRNNYTWIWDQIYSEMEMDGVTLLLELISVSTGLLCVPIVYSNVTPRHNDYHHSWGVSWVRRKENGNGMVEL